MRLTLLLAFLGVTVACGSADRAADRAAREAERRLLEDGPPDPPDSMRRDGRFNGFTLIRPRPPQGDTDPYARPVHELEIELADRMDTVPGLLVRHSPAYVTDTLAIGLSVDARGVTNGLYTVRRPSGEVLLFDLPEDLDGARTGIAISPDGTRLAYVHFDGVGGAQGMIREWPLGLSYSVTRTVDVSAVPSASGSASWQGGNTWWIFIDAFKDGSGRRVHFRGTGLAPATREDTAVFR